MNINFNSLQKTHKERASETYKQIAQLVGGDPDTSSVGGIDITGASDAHKAAVEKILSANLPEGAKELPEAPATAKADKK